MRKLRTHGLRCGIPAPPPPLLQQILRNQCLMSRDKVPRRRKLIFWSLLLSRPGGHTRITEACAYTIYPWEIAQNLFSSLLNTYIHTENEYKHTVERERDLGIIHLPLCCLCSSVPSCGPTNVSAFATTSSSILVRWFEVPEPDRNGLILGYKVCLCFLCFKFIPYSFTEPGIDLLLLLLLSDFFLCPRWIRWSTKRRTPTAQFNSGLWMGTPPTVSS